MTSYAPPIENVAIFDSANFKAGETTLTQNDADKRYLRFPNAQGTETLSSINVNGLATFNNTIKFPDNSVQSNAYTGAGALAGTYTSSNITLDSNGKITTIANGGGGGSNINANSLTTDTAPTVAAVTTTGIVNGLNTGSIFGAVGNTNVVFTNGPSNLFPGINVDYYSPSTIPAIQFINSAGTNTFNVMTRPCLFELTVYFYTNDGVNQGQCSCNILILPPAIQSNWGFFGSGNLLEYNINNAINGNTNFNSSFNSSGRQYWTFNQKFSGGSALPAAFGYLMCRDPPLTTGVKQISIWIQDFSLTTRWSWSLKCLDASAATDQGIGVKVIGEVNI